MSTVTTTGFEALTVVHPQHAERIAAAQAAKTPGAIVAIEGNVNHFGTFYTGVRNGDHVVVTDKRTVQVVDGDAAHLIVNSAMTLVAVEANDLTVSEAQAASRAADKAATAAMERALCSANGLVGAPAGDDAALAALREANDLRNLAFAYRILAGWIAGMVTGDRYHLDTLARAR